MRWDQKGSEVDDVTITSWQNGYVKISIDGVQVVNGRRIVNVSIYDSTEEEYNAKGHARDKYATIKNGDQFNITLTSRDEK